MKHFDAVRKAGMKFVGVFDEKSAVDAARLHRKGSVYHALGRADCGRNCLSIFIEGEGYED